MWEELEIETKLCIDNENDDNQKISKIFFGEGNKEAKIVVLFEGITEKMLKADSIINSEDINVLKIIFEFTGISLDDCYFTALNKYHKKGIIEESQREDNMRVLLKELYLVNPKYLIVIGQNLFDYIYKYYTKNTSREILVDIGKNVGKIFEFYGMGLIPLYNLQKIHDLKNKDKKVIVELLKGIN